MAHEGHGRPRCANCGLEIVWEPIRVNGEAYCCSGCAQGGPCCCSYDPPEGALPLPAAQTSSQSKPQVGAATVTLRRAR